MKKQLLVLSAAIIAGGGLLASCSNNTTSTSDTSTSTSETPVVNETKTLTVAPEEGSKITLGGGVSEQVKVGSKVTFKAEVTDKLKELVSVKLDDDQLVVDSLGNGWFTMPDHDVTLKTELFTKGDGSLTNVTSLPDDFTAPTTLADVKAIFEEGAKVEGKFSSVETFNNTYSNVKFGSAGNYANGLSLTAKNSRDNQVLVTGNALTGSSNSSTQPYVWQAGLHDDTHFYSFEGLGNYNLTTTKFELTPKTYDVVDEATGSKNVITKDEAELKSSTYGFVSIIDTYVINSTILWNTDDADNTVTCEKASDGKSFTVTLSATLASSRKVSSISAVVDGDNFISKVDFTTKVYSSDGWDSDANAPKADAVATTDQFLSFNATRDYKDKVDMIYDIEDYVMHDYDVIFYATPKGGYSSDTTELTDDKIDGNSKLAYKVRSNDENSLNSVKPRIVDLTDEFGEISADGTTIAEVEKLGEFKVTLDNGLGEQKEFTFTSVTPKTTKITISGTDGDYIFANSETEVTAVAFPELADQSGVDLVKDESYSAGVDVTITKKSDGVWTIKPLAAGKVYLKATDSSSGKSATRNFNVVEKPTADSVKAALTDADNPKSVYGSASVDWTTHYFYINFDADGTAEFIVKKGYYGTPTKVSSFNWTVDSDVNFTFSNYQNVDANNSAEITKLTYISSSVISVSFDFLLNGVGDSVSKTFSLATRVEASA